MNPENLDCIFFKVLIKELQSLALDIKVLDKDNNEIDLRQDFDDGLPANTVFDEKNVITDDINDSYQTVDEKGEAETFDSNDDYYQSDNDDEFYQNDNDSLFDDILNPSTDD